ncbi:ATP-binding protein [Coleofasciculus sp. FACHB-T130]|uniref:ATP-binding protein n=2 Tax=Cyanophyceae TaxID=3028117 RepID=UPI001F556FA7|nr:ATP-binding protein [Coleofasciculus sp. FACHB-T130]
METMRIPFQLIWVVVAICVLPSLLNLLGVDFASPKHPFEVPAVVGMSPRAFVEAMQYTLSGSFLHTILECSAFCIALSIVILSLIHFSLKRDAVTLIIGVAMFCAGCMDTFHALAADRLSQGIADSQNLIPLTWAVCRLFNALILLGGAGIFLATKPGKWKGGAGFVAIASVSFAVASYTIVYFCTHSAIPATIFPNAIVTRPWDVPPLLLFIFAGIFVFPRFYNAYPSRFSLALAISMIPQIASQLHMAFGSTALFDNHFNIAHFLKIIAYLVPFIGLSSDYIHTLREEALTVDKLEATQKILLDKTKQLELINLELQKQIAERQQVEEELHRSNVELERRVEERTAEIRQTNDLLLLEVSERKQSENRYREKSQELKKTLLDLQKTQAQLIQTEKISSLGQLVAGVAHEINNPINFIHGNINYACDYANSLLYLLHLYQQQYPPTPEIDQEIEASDLDFIIEDLPKLLKSMHLGIERIREIVQSLRSFSRVDQAEMKPVDIHEGIDSTLLILQYRLKAIAGGPTITVTKEYSDLPLVECYAGQLNQVFMNLLSNAIDALEESVAKEEIFCLLPSIKISTAVEDEKLAVIRIADNGPGMTEEVRSHLFDAFFTTKPVGKGTGLGLSISYQIVVEKHSGSMECISAPGEGAEFVIKIPISQNKISQL